MISETCKRAINLMRYISNCSAQTIVYEKNWTETFSHGEIKNCFNKCKENMDWKKIFSLTDEERLILGFRYFDEPDQNKKHNPMLIPIWIVACLPKGFKLKTKCIDGNESIIDFDIIDKDTRNGCIAYTC